MMMMMSMTHKGEGGGTEPEVGGDGHGKTGAGKGDAVASRQLVLAAALLPARLPRFDHLTDALFIVLFLLFVVLFILCVQSYAPEQKQKISSVPGCECAYI